MSDSDVWTIGRLLTWTTDFLKQRNSTSPRLDAEILLANARGCERIELYTAFEEEPTDEVRTAFRELVRRRSEGEPVAYLVGQREFYSLAFKVTPDVLIPRPETEFVVVALLDAIKAMAQRPPKLRIADVGTGSGVLAVCAAKNVSGSEIVAVDVSSAALDVARSNAELHAVADRIEFIESDLFASIVDGAFHFILSNPPYVSLEEMDGLSDEVAKYEPRLALVGGETGTEIIERLIPDAAERLVPGGALILEISPMIEMAVHRLITEHGGFQTPSSIKDLEGRARVVVAERSA